MQACVFLLEILYTIILQCCTLMANKMSFFFSFPTKDPLTERKKEDNILSAATMYEANLEMIS